MIKKTKTLKHLNDQDFAYLNALSLHLSSAINSDKETLRQLNTIKASNKKNFTTYSLGRISAELITEGSKGHAMLKTAICLQLGRGLNKGERKRLTWLVSGQVKQLQSGAIARNITDRAKQIVASGQDIRGSQAIKNIA